MLSPSKISENVGLFLAGMALLLYPLILLLPYVLTVIIFTYPLAAVCVLFDCLRILLEKHFRISITEPFENIFGKSLPAPPQTVNNSTRPSMTLSQQGMWCIVTFSCAGFVGAFFPVSRCPYPSPIYPQAETEPQILHQRSANAYLSPRDRDLGKFQRAKD